MPINPISATNAAVNSTQAIPPSREAGQTQRAHDASSAYAANPADEQAQQPKPTINGTGQTVGTLINVTA